MSLLIIALILVSGFEYIKNYPPENYHFSRSSGWTAYIQAIRWGVLCFFIVIIVDIFLDLTGFLSSLFELIPYKKATSTISYKPLLTSEKYHFLNLALLSALSARFFAKIKLFLNKIFKCLEKKTESTTFFKIPNYLKSKLTSKNTDPIESILSDSAEHLSALMVTLKSRKVYIGVVNALEEHLAATICDTRTKLIRRAIIYYIWDFE